MDNIMSYIKDSAIILIPVLNILGMILKFTEKISDKYIPLILLPIGIIFAIALMGLNIDAVIQGILVTGASVYVDQLIKQSKKKE